MDTQPFSHINNLFEHSTNKESIYFEIISLGKNLAEIDSAFITQENRVEGCQSVAYLIATVDCEGNMNFQGSSDALISRGLMTLMIKAYGGRSPEFVLKTPPTFLEELGISSSISITRANGVMSMYTRMKQLALKAYMALAKKP